jgi:hypothetical protein
MPGNPMETLEPLQLYGCRVLMDAFSLKDHKNNINNNNRYSQNPKTLEP